MQKELNGKSNPDVVKCDTFIDAVQTKTACNGLWTARSEEHVIHCNNIGPSEMPRIGISQSIHTMVVGKSRFGSIYKISSRTELQNCFFEFKKWIGRAPGTSVKRLYSDQGGEYT